MKVNKTFAYLSIILLLINSGSAIGIIFGKITIPLFLGSTLMYMHQTNKKINAINYKALVLMIVYIIFNYIIHITDMVNIESYMILILNLVSSMFLISSLKYSEFKKAYINIMFFVSIFCLTIFFIGTKYDLYQYAFNYKDHSIIWGFNLHAIKQARNSGLFWEPGGYQIFLNLALFFMMDNKEVDLSKKWLQVIVFVISILTTQSTTGYLILSIMCCYYIISLVKKQNRYINKILLLILITPVIIYILNALLNSNVVNDKFSNTNYSYVARINHLTNSWNAIKISPIWGFGYQSQTKILLQGIYGLVNNSVGFFSTALNFGIPYVIYYITRIIFIYKKSKSHYINIIYFIITLFMICISQAIFDYPILLIFLFSYRPEDDKQYNTVKYKVKYE